jgi:hypothetical protein
MYVPIPPPRKQATTVETVRRSFVPRMIASAMLMALVSAVLFLDGQPAAGAILALFAVVPIALALWVLRTR